MKKTFVNILRPVIVPAFVLCVALSMVGCKPEGESAEVAKMRDENGTKLRKYFDSCWAKVDRCAPEDKAALLKLPMFNGDAAKAQELFDQIIARGGRPPRGPNPPPDVVPNLPVPGSNPKAK
jgi:hypothetical protein